MKNEFFERLTLALEARGWTPTRLEREAKFSKGHLSKMKKGKGVKVEAETLSKISRALDVSYEWLATGAGEMGHAGPEPARHSAPLKKKVTPDA